MIIAHWGAGIILAGGTLITNTCKVGELNGDADGICL